MIGIKYKSVYAVNEIFQLLKTQWEWYDESKTYDVVIAEKADVPGYQGNLIDLTGNDYFQKICKELHSGKCHAHQPSVELLLNNLRNELKQYSTLVEIPASPWQHPYMLALTHDVDNISAKQSSLRSVGVAAVRCMLQSNIKKGFELILAKFGLGQDPWLLFERWKQIERELGVRSTFYIIPPHNIPICSHPYRDARYTMSQDQITDLQDGGWEVGVHGMNNWIHAGEGIAELSAVKGGIGNRTHWLLRNWASWCYLDLAGYEYDSTFGYDDDIGFRAGTTQAYCPFGASRLLELPLHIQDMGLLGKTCWAQSKGMWIKLPCLNATEDEAKRLCKELFNYAKLFGGTITLLWHYESIAAPRDWTEMYQYLVAYAKQEGAWITTAKNVVEWFRVRRSTKITYSIVGKKITISVIRVNRNKDIPDQKVRVHIDKTKIESVDGEYQIEDQFVDIRCDRPELTVILKEPIV